MHPPLRQLALCVDCEACFAIGTASCPACGGETWVLLTKFLDKSSLRTPPPFDPLPRSWREGSRRDDTSGRALAQVLVIARDQVKLYEYARRAFAGNPTVEVVLDRRRTERRAAERARIPERRRGDRRLTLEIEDRLRTAGWAIVRRDVFQALGFAQANAR